MWIAKINGREDVDLEIPDFPTVDPPRNITIEERAMFFYTAKLIKRIIYQLFNTDHEKKIAYYKVLNENNGRE